jgi:hypothetical protein
MFRLLCGLLLCLALTRSASAVFHEWNIEEIFSSANGSVQYIELRTNVDSQNFMDDHELVSEANANTYIFDGNLPSTNTAGRSLLLGTLAFAALPGAVAPDYVIPSNFFSIDGDTIRLVDAPLTFTFADAQLPLDGRTALKFDLTTAINSPTNFAGAEGSITVTDLPPWRNPVLPLDVDADGNVEPLDVLVLINAINNGLNALPNPPAAPLIPPPYYDPDGNGFLQALDVLSLINFLNSQPTGAQGLVPFAMAAGPSSLIAPVPEPGTLQLGGSGFAMLVFASARRCRRLGKESIALARGVC